MSVNSNTETSQELQMLSSVTINCQETKIVINPGSLLSELLSVSQMSQVSITVFSLVKIASVSKLSNFIENFQNCQKL